MNPAHSEKDCNLTQNAKTLMEPHTQSRLSLTCRRVQMEKVTELYEDALDDKETTEIRAKENELKAFLLEEQLMADGENPVTRSAVRPTKFKWQKQLYATLLLSQNFMRL